MKISVVAAVGYCPAKETVTESFDILYKVFGSTMGGNMKQVLAIDMGATSIRGILGYIENGQFQMQEVMRMSHQIIRRDGKMKWQWQEIMNQIADTIDAYGNKIVSVGIDTWGVDFGLLDIDGNLIDSPLSYRDPKHIDGHRLALEKMSEEEIFLQTGNQVMAINTLFQLLSYRHHYPENWKKVKTVLMMPDLIQYMLTGQKVGEETIWSTSQILNLQTAEYSSEILEKMNFSSNLFPSIIKAGEISGNTQNSVLEKLRKYSIDVISVCGHDTASAVLLTEAFYQKDCLFLSCGTWSLIGSLVDNAVITREAYQRTLTNELGYESKAMFFKNITGLYLFEKYKSQLETEWGRKIDFSEINDFMAKAKPTDLVIDMEREAFGREDVLVKIAIDDYLIETGQTLPENEMKYFQIIYNSLAEKYLQTMQAIETLAGRSFQKIHMIGGGAKSEYLCQLIADKLSLPVVAGPFEATAMGNILIQLKAVGEIGSVEEGLALVKQNEKMKYYQPKES